LNILAMGNLQSGQAGFLKALIGIGAVPEKPKGCLPGRWTLSAQDLLPVRHSLLPPLSLVFNRESFPAAFFLQGDLPKPI
jgi:hypothetical protein